MVRKYTTTNSAITTLLIINYSASIFVKNTIFLLHDVALVVVSVHTPSTTPTLSHLPTHKHRSSHQELTVNFLSSTVLYFLYLFSNASIAALILPTPTNCLPRVRRKWIRVLLCVVWVSVTLLSLIGWIYSVYKAEGYVRLQVLLTYFSVVCGGALIVFIAVVSVAHLFFRVNFYTSRFSRRIKPI